ncbi:MAG: response regulator transcription factor [Armatimonadetes bacterium]|nr:response regulator transcription factor [Armatimonadota bacterium]
MGKGREVSLTDRELEVLVYISEGWTSHQVADKLNIGKKTVDYHLSKIYIKLEVSSRIQAFAKAASLGLIPRKPRSLESQEEGQSS